MIKVLSRFVLFFAIWNWNQVPINALLSGLTCRTPHNKQGQCIPLNECTELVNYTKSRGNSPTSMKYVIGHRCSPHGDINVRVCCPMSSAANNQKIIADMEHCGRGRVDGDIAVKIVDGQDAELGDYPWMAALGYRKAGSSKISWFCGGALISSRFVLTAGHCIRGTGELQLYKVRLGVVNLNNSVQDWPKAVDIFVEKIIVHEKFSGVAPNVENDIALIRLEREVSYNEYIKPICLPRQPQFHESSMINERAYVAGWGKDGLYGSFRPILQYVDLPIVGSDDCNKAYRKMRATIDKRNLCAGYREGGKDSCIGDSGGPLMWQNQSDARYYAVGIVSFGYKCAERGFPGVYTKVTEFIDFIDSNI